MNAVSRLAGLMRWQGWPILSLYMPLHRAGRDARQNPIRLKNALREAVGKLVQAGLRRPEARRLVEAGTRGLEEPPGNVRGQGLALFAGSDRHEILDLPMGVPERVVVGGHPHLKPLLPLLSGDGRFYLLAVSQNAVRVLEASRDGFRPLEIPGMPSDVDEALRFDVVQEQLNAHVLPAHGGQPGPGQALFHGHGEGSADTRRKRAGEFLRQVARAMEGALQGVDAPVVFAGADPLPAMFRDASGWPGLVEEAVPGNPELLDDGELHRRAWEIMAPRLQRARQDAEQRFRDMAGSGLTTTDLGEVLRAAHDGIVDTLFAASDAEAWGWYHEDTRTALMGESLPAPALGGGEDLIDRAAVETALRRGAVFVMPRASMPQGAGAAALLRYAVPLPR